MGAAQSQEHKGSHRSPQEIYAEITRKLSNELSKEEQQLLRSNFERISTTDVNSHEKICTQEAFTAFLDLPQSVSSLLYASACTIAAYPLIDNAPMPLSFEALLRVVCIMTNKTGGIVSTRAKTTIVLRSIAVPTSISRPGGGEKPAPILLESKHFRALITFLLSLSAINSIRSAASEKTMGSLKMMENAAHAIIRAISTSDLISLDDIEMFMSTSAHLLDAMSDLFEKFITQPSMRTTKYASSSVDSSIMNDSLQAQLSTFLMRDLVYGKLDLLYRADRDGFSMGSFETKTLRYPGPTILLLTGSHTAGEAKTVLGIFSDEPWKQSSKSCFGSSRAILFQLRPMQILSSNFSSMNSLWFHKTLGLGIGSQPPSLGKPVIVTASASLFVDTNLEEAQVHFDSPAMTMKVSITDMEVFGLGGSESLLKQREAWEWQEMEAARRQNINIKDHQGDWDLLEMAGLVGQHRSGGSI